MLFCFCFVFSFCSCCCLQITFRPLRFIIILCVSHHGRFSFTILATIPICILLQLSIFHSRRIQRTFPNGTHFRFVAYHFIPVLQSNGNNQLEVMSCLGSNLLRKEFQLLLKIMILLDFPTFSVKSRFRLNISL